MELEFDKGFTDEERYLGLSKSAYREAISSSPSVEERLSDMLKSDSSIKAREQMYRAVLRFDYVLSELDRQKDIKSCDKQLIDIVRKIAEDMVQVLSVDRQPSAREFILNLDKSPWLFHHLDKTGESIVSFFANTQRVSLDNEVILTSRHADLMEFVGRTHDVCKLLGGLNAQIDPDHEIIYREVIGKHLNGKRFITQDGREIVFGPEDVRFIIGVVGLHEDIWREAGFANQAESLHKSMDLADPDIAIARGRTILHFVDIFGDAVRFDEGSLKIVNQDAFKSRFVDLFRRHLKLPIIHKRGDIQEDWSLGKVFRPQWGEYDVEGLVRTFAILKSEWGISVDPKLIPTVQNEILQVLKDAESAIVGVRQEGSSYQYTTDMHSNLIELIPAIQKAFLDIEAEGHPKLVDELMASRSAVRPKSTFIKNISSDKNDPSSCNWETLLRTLQQQFPNEEIYLEPDAYEIGQGKIIKLENRDANGNRTFALYFGQKTTLTDLSRYERNRESPVMN